MRIVYRGNFTHPFCTEVHVAWALEELGHKVLRLQEAPGAWAAASLHRDEFDLFLWTRTWNYEPEVGHRFLASIRGKIPSASVHLDRYIGLDREAQIRDGDPFWATDMVFTADGGHDDEFDAYGINHFWMPPAMHAPEAVKAYSSSPPAHDVIFVGSVPYPHAEWQPKRQALLDAMAKAFGDGFAIYPQASHGKKRPIRGLALNELYASSKAVIGDSCLVPNLDGSPVVRYWSDRVVETMGRGGRLVHPYVEGLERYADHGLTLFPLGDVEAAVEAVRAVVNDGAEESLIYRSESVGYISEYDTYTVRMKKVLEIVADFQASQQPPVKFAHMATHVTTGQWCKTPLTGQFRLAPGSGCAEALTEVWQANDYHLPATRWNDSPTVIDIGANIGAFTVLASKLGASVMAFEPHPANYEALAHNLTLNGVVGCATARVAVYGTLPVEAVVMSGEGGGAFPVNQDPYLLPVAHEMSPVPPVTIGDIYRSMIRPVELLKIDCEGGEYDIIDGMGPAEFAATKRIALEFHGPEMPHLTQRLGPLNEHLLRWGAMVAKLAEYGHVKILGHPRRGGLIWWDRY